MVRVKGGEEQQNCRTALQLVFKQKSKGAQPIKEHSPGSCSTDRPPGASEDAANEPQHRGQLLPRKSHNIKASLLRDECVPGPSREPIWQVELLSPAAGHNEGGSSEGSKAFFQPISLPSLQQ